MHKYTKLIKMIDDANTSRIVIALNVFSLFSHIRIRAYKNKIYSLLNFNILLCILFATSDISPHHTSYMMNNSRWNAAPRQPDKKCWQDKYILKRNAFSRLSYRTFECYHHNHLSFSLVHQFFSSSSSYNTQFLPLSYNEADKIWKLHHLSESLSHTHTDIHSGKLLTFWLLYVCMYKSRWGVKKTKSKEEMKIKAKHTHTICWFMCDTKFECIYLVLLVS